MKPIRIVLVEDHTVVREGTRRILEQSPDLAVVGEAEDGEAALELIKQLQPDVAILDIRMRNLSGIEVVREMGEFCSHTRALILTAYDDDEYVMALMGAGALGYLLKTAHSTELIEAIRSVHSGEAVLDSAIAAKVARLWAGQGMSGKPGTSEQLSPRELEVLAFAAKSLSNKAIADSLNISVRTVESHFRGMFIKLKVSSRSEAVRSALSQRLITLEEDGTA
ncbi:MAG: response regulator transcription factor [Dehalococcoidia bacterium]